MRGARFMGDDRSRQGRRGTLLFDEAARRRVLQTHTDPVRTKQILWEATVSKPSRRSFLEALSATAALSCLCPAQASKVLVQLFEGRQTEPISASPYAASTASHTCRIMALGLVISDVSNCPFLILFANSIPLNVTSAFPTVLNPSIGKHFCFTIR